MITSSRKLGRPTGFYRASWGERIDGLARLGDGRWKVSGPKPVKFTESDERLAVARALQIVAQREQATVRVPRAAARVGDADAVRQALAMFPTPAGDPDKLTGTFRPPGISASLEKGLPPPIAPEPIRIEVQGEQMLFFQERTQAAAFWAWLREMLLTNGEYLARMTGVQQLAWLDQVDRPADSPRLDDLIKIYAAKPGVSAEEIARVRRIWKEFTKCVGVETVREIRHAHAEAYEAKISTLGLSPKSVKHRYSRVRTVLAYAVKRGKGIDDCRKALDVLAMLEVETPDPLDPEPITPAQFWAIHRKAKRADNPTFAAMMLFALNAALYPSEVGSVRWSDIDLKRGEFATRRRKTGVPRLAMLWPETLAAIKALPRDAETVFHTARPHYKRPSVFRDWDTYRAAAKLPKVKFAQIRDAAFTVACRVSLDEARVLAGHRMPGAVDNYVLRRPQFVAAACEAVRLEFIRHKRPG